MKNQVKSFSETEVINLSKEFSKVLKSWLDADQWQKLLELNKGELHACSSHDYCDANMAMDEAFRNIMGRSFCFASDIETEEEQKQYAEDTFLFNKAWSLAKANSFYSVPYEEEREQLLFNIAERNSADLSYIQHHPESRSFMEREIERRNLYKAGNIYTVDYNHGFSMGKRQYFITRITPNGTVYGIEDGNTFRELSVNDVI